jgi:hypothetical protein
MQLTFGPKMGGRDDVESAAHYRQEAAKMRKFAESATDSVVRNQLLELAAEYDKLAERADARRRKPGSPNQS